MTEQMTHEEALVWDDLILKIVRWAAYDFPDMDKDELRQNLWEYILSHPKIDPDRQGVTSLLQGITKKKCWDQRKEQLQYSVQYSYRTTDVRKLLETAFFYLDWHDGFVPDDAVSIDHMAAYDIRADITQALQKMRPAPYRDAIIERYRDGVEHPPGSKERQRLNRGVQRLTMTLNWYYPYTNRRRKATPNTSAISRIESQEYR